MCLQVSSQSERCQRNVLVTIRPQDQDGSGDICRDARLLTVGHVWLCTREVTQGKFEAEGV